MSFSMNDNVISLEAYRKCPPNRRKYVKLAVFSEVERIRRLEKAQRNRDEAIKRGMQNAIDRGYIRWMHSEPTSGLRSRGIDPGAV